VLGDWVPMGLSTLAGRRISSNSLDNTIRILSVVPSEWYLLEIEGAGIRNGFGHGQLRIWAESGTLMAIASQSVVVRERRNR
jgi:acyl-CoA thioesterase